MLFYDLLYFLILFPALPFWVGYLFKEEYRLLLMHRLVPGIQRTEKKRIWLHAVSVGEVRSLKFLIKQLLDLYPEHEMVLSVTTPAGYAIAKKDYPAISIINAPLDFSFTIRRFLKEINPEILILNELEIWPNWIRMTHQMKIPILLINGRISDRAFKRYQFFKLILKPFFRKITKYLVQADIYKDRFEQLGIEPSIITVCGNIKADEAMNTRDQLTRTLEMEELLSLSLPNTSHSEYIKSDPPAPDTVFPPHSNHNTSKRMIVTLASSHASDENLTIPVMKEFSGRLIFIIVPRHLDRVPEIEALLTAYHLNTLTWSKRNPAPESHPDVIIFDRMGELFNILNISDLVFMGGTMEEKIGGHNLYEPAVLGKIIAGGPCFNNFPAIGADLVSRGVYHIVHNSDDFKTFLQNSNRLDKAHLGNEAIQTVISKQGSIQCILNAIRPLIP